MTEHWVRTHPTARKEHRCVLCRRTIRVGETYLRGVHFDGTAYSWKECAHCDVLFRYLTTLWGEYEYSADMVAEWEVESIGQARIKAMWKMRWQRRDGGLQPVPVLWKRWRMSANSGRYYVINGIGLESVELEDLVS